MFLGENPIHIEVENKSDIAKLVLMPGDPLRAKYIAETSWKMLSVLQVYVIC